MTGDVDYRKSTSGYLMKFAGGAVSWQSSKHPTFHSRSKHIEVRYQWIQDVMEMKSFVVEKIHTDDNASDMMTKPLPREKFQFCRKEIGLMFKYKIKVSEGHRGWMKNPKILENCSTGFHFSSQSGEPVQEKNVGWLLIFIIDKYIFCSHIHT
ncbi:hypothetical protein SADUNF_Sadunf13G0107300 [Salix dunnii]|uniref:Uncharacterized protein n=1 Tax=Salix dunnii TaxID=1413687 RepID=A0A835JLU0_9ROSI|nr:hypothetical protein SADUNF_Sadunf13G0107300 [Salix dunnii]